MANIWTSVGTTLICSNWKKRFKKSGCPKEKSPLFLSSDAAANNASSKTAAPTYDSASSDDSTTEFAQSSSPVFLLP